MAARFEVYEKTGWRWMLIDDNNEPIATTEPYDSKADAKRGAENVEATAPNAPSSAERRAERIRLAGPSSSRSAMIERRGS